VRFPGPTHLVIGFEHRKEAERFLEQLRDRLREFGLELHPEKTRLIQFGRYAIERRRRNGAGKPETFNFLGFTHICGSIRKTGKFTVMRKTIGKRMAAKLKAIKAELRRRMHEPIQDTGDWLRAVVRGYLNYHAVPGNFPRLRSFRRDVIRKWVAGCAAEGPTSPPRPGTPFPQHPRSIIESKGT